MNKEPLFDLRIEGQDWQEEVTLEAIFHALENAFKAASDGKELMFLIRDEGGTDYGFSYDALMFEALCEDLQAFRMYMNMCGVTDSENLQEDYAIPLADVIERKRAKSYFTLSEAYADLLADWVSHDENLEALVENHDIG